MDRETEVGDKREGPPTGPNHLDNSSQMLDQGSHATAVTQDDPFLRRIGLYLAERFPPLGYGILIVSYSSSNQFLAQALARPDHPVHYSPGSVLAAITLLCLFFHLRVFDEHKDYADDCRYFPGRVLQRSVVTLRELRALGIAAITLEILLSALSNSAALVAVLIALGFSLLMLKEFFVSAWLKRHFLLYASTHMLIMPLFAMVVFGFAVGRYPWQAPGWFWLYAFVGFFVTFNWEVSRKIRAPEEEIDGVETYTKIFGTYGAAYIVLAIRVIDTSMVALVGWHLGLSRFFYVTLVVLFLVCLIGFFQFRFNTNARTAKRMETYAGMYIIAFDLTLAVALAKVNGLEILR